MVNGHWTAIVGPKTPPDIVGLMMRMASHLTGEGKVLRLPGTGKGSQALIEFASDHQLFLPRGRPLHGDREFSIRQLPTFVQATALATEIFPQWAEYNEFSRSARLSILFALLGADLMAPSEFLFCFSRRTPAEEPEDEHGSDYAALVIAKHLQIPAYNLADPPIRHRTRQRLDALGA